MDLYKSLGTKCCEAWRFRELIYVFPAADHTNDLPQDRITLGIYREDRTAVQNTPQEQSILEDIGGILTAGGTEVTIVPEIQRQKFAKNFWNVAFSSYATLTG